MEIFGFMHVAMMNNWRDVVTEQVDKIKHSGLYDASQKIFVGIGGNIHHNHDWIEGKYTELFRCPKLYLGELPTIDELHWFSKTHDSCKIWYIHTKGVSHTGPQQANVMAWRRYMEYFVIEQHKLCSETLDSYDACGVDWYYPNDERHRLAWNMNIAANNCHFTGNFWWARSDYVKTLRPVKLGPGYNRHEAETFITSGNLRHKCLHHSYKNLYAFHYDRRFYEQPLI